MSQRAAALQVLVVPPSAGGWLMLVSIAGLAACAADRPTLPPNLDPSNPDAVEGRPALQGLTAIEPPPVQGPAMDMSGMEGMDHSKMGAMPGMESDKSKPMAGMDHSKMGAMPGMGDDKSKPMAGMDHSKVGAMPGKESDKSKPAMDHSKMGAMPGKESDKSSPGMDHSKMGAMPGMEGDKPMPGMDHSKMEGGEHEDGNHLLGTVVSSSGKQLVLEEKEHTKQVAISIDEKTKIERAGKPATAADLKPGTRVAVHTRVEKAGVVALLIKIGEGGAEARGVPERKPAPDYTCPMHPEVSQPGPGRCPKCGMTLAPRAPEKKGGE